MANTYHLSSLHTSCRGPHGPI